MATNVPTTSLHTDAIKVKNLESIAAQLCSTLNDLEYENLYRIFTSKKKFACIGVLTTIDPRYIVLIVIDEPQGAHHTGGCTCSQEYYK